MRNEVFRNEVFLLNFGGPTSSGEVEPFLRRLFEDPFIIRSRMPEALRLWLARRIAKKRAPKADAEYQKIGYSPLNRMTDAQAKHLDAILSKERPGTRVHVVNRYTGPFAEDVLARMDLAEARIFLISLYPHVCHSTTVSSMRDFDLAAIRRTGRADLPSTRVFSWWHHPGYLSLTLAALTKSLGEAMRQGSGQLTVVFSAHGLPDRYFRRGDPYVTEIQAHAAELRRRGDAWLKAQAGAPDCAWHVSFQSRVGPVEWVRPYTDEILGRLGKERGGRLVLVPISFTADHIETLYEMDHTYRDLALASGFSHVVRAAPANDDPALARCLADLLLQHGL